MRPSNSSVPTGQRPIREALISAEPLAGLLRRLDESRQRLAAAAGLVPAELANLIDAGPLDDTAWVLLVPHSAAAAKLRQVVPQIETAVAAAGFAPRELKVKVRRPR